MDRGRAGAFPIVGRSAARLCADCGTPLTFETVAAKRLNVTISSLDNPAAVNPVTQDGVEARISSIADLPSSPEIFTDAPARTSHQHPDHDL